MDKYAGIQSYSPNDVTSSVPTLMVAEAIKFHGGPARDRVVVGNHLGVRRGTCAGDKRSSAKEHGEASGG